jgi:hypothetical protein
MSSLHSKACGVDMIADGHTNGWNKQMALRGRARQYDENGVCGKQRLVVGSDLKRFMLNVEKLFPGAKVPTIGAFSDNSTLADRILGLLSKTQDRVLTTKAIAPVIERDWRQVSPDVLTPFFRKRLEVLGWKYVPVKGKVGRGKLGTRFERLQSEQSQHEPTASLLAEQAPSVVLSATQVPNGALGALSEGALSAYL